MHRFRELFCRDLFTYAEAVSVGATSDVLRKALRSGSIVRIRRGWYSGAEIDGPIELHRLRALAEVAEHRGSRASHYSAAILHGLPVHDVQLGIVQISLDKLRDGRKRRDLLVHGPFRDPGRLSPTVPAVSPALAVLQTAELSPVAGLMAADFAVRHGVATELEIHLALDELGGRRYGPAAAVVLGMIDGHRESPPESRLAYVLDQLGYDLQPQYQVHTRSGSKWADGLIKGTWVLCEYDGRDKYDGVEAVIKEKVREDDLRDLGYEFVRVTKETLDGSASLLRSQVERAVARSFTNHGGRLAPGSQPPRRPLTFRGRPRLEVVERFRVRSAPDVVRTDFLDDDIA